MLANALPFVSCGQVTFAGATVGEGFITLSLGRHPLNHSKPHEQRRLTWPRVEEQPNGLRRSVLDEVPLSIGTGTHYANIFVGTPPQRVSVIVDTGSHYTAFPCTGCQGCGAHTDEYFSMSGSNSSRELKCGRGRYTDLNIPLVI
jgi:hypothetical protein